MFKQVFWNFRFNITELIPFDCVKKVCACILDLKNEYVVWPHQKKKRISTGQDISQHVVNGKLFCAFLSELVRVFDRN